jgi:streptogrisin C
MELTKFLAVLAVFLPVVYGAPTDTANNLHPEILAAMKRDLGLDAVQAHARVTRELKATETIEHLQNLAGSAFAGAWLTNEGHTINVGITDEALAAEVTAAGATPALVSNSLTKLQEAKAALDKIHFEKADTLSISSAEAGVAAYYVDVTTNKLVLEATEAGTTQAEALATQVGLSASEFEVRTIEEMPVPLATVQGGNPYYIGGSRCSVGFAVTTGFVSAGHCGRAGTSVQASSGGATLGSFSGSVFPGSADMSFVRTVSGTTLRGTIAGSGQTISGSTASGVGAAICRSGSTTGVFCGSVRALGATVNYSQGSVTGLTQTNVCAEPGDSGGPFYSGAQAQGVTSGGSGNCNSGGTTYFQPVNEILSTYGLTLVRG